MAFVMELHSKIILHADDDAFNLKFVHTLLDPFYLVLTCYSGKHLLEHLECMHADLILLDVEMPEMDGWETLKSLKKNDATKNIPVVFLSGNDSREEMEKGLSLGAADFIVKPFINSDFLERINSLLNTKQLVMQV
jgi:putative two-component system response regulator